MPNELKISLANLWRLSQKVVELLPSMWEALDSVPGQGVERNKRNRFLYPRIGVGADKRIGSSSVPISVPQYCPRSGW